MPRYSVSLPRYSFLTLLMFLNIINMVDRNLISSFGPQIIEDLTLTDSQFGLLTGFIFVFFYAIMGLFMGTLADRTHRVRLIAIGVFIWSLLTAVSGAARNFLHIGIARLFIGVGESALTPASMSILSDMFPSAERGKVSGIYYLGVPLGAGGSFLVAGLLGPIIGWRDCFYLLGGIGIVFSLLLFFLREVPRGEQDKDSQILNKTNEPEQNATDLKTLLPIIWQQFIQSPALMFTMLGAIFLHIPLGSGQFAIVWLERERGLDAAYITTLYGVLFLICGSIGVLLGGFLSDWYQHHFRGGRVRFLTYFMLFMTPFIWSYRWVDPSNILFYIGMCSGIIAVTSFYGPAFSTIQDLTKSQFRGIMTAFLLLASNMLGIGIGALMTGILSDLFNSMQWSQPLTYSLVIGDILSAFGVLCFYLASRHIQPNLKTKISN